MSVEDIKEIFLSKIIFDLKKDFLNENTEILGKI